MLRNLRIVALLLLPVPVAYALLALASPLVPMNGAALGPLVLPEAIVTGYGIFLSQVGAAEAVRQAATRRGGRARLRLGLLLIPPLTLSILVTYGLTFYLYLYRIFRPDVPESLVLGVAALTLVPPLGLFAYAAYAEHHPVTSAVQQAGG
jgi:hypothetical protein